MRALAEYEKYCEDITVEAARDLLLELDCDQEKIIICAPGGNYTIPVLEYCQGLEQLLAEHVNPIQFCGGPPGEYFWVVGSLKTMVIDKLMYYDAVAERRMRIGC
jgi:hypothetical protein